MKKLKIMIRGLSIITYPAALNLLGLFMPYH